MFECGWFFWVSNLQYVRIASAAHVVTSAHAINLLGNIFRIPLFSISFKCLSAFQFMCAARSLSSVRLYKSVGIHASMHHLCHFISLSGECVTKTRIILEMCVDWLWWWATEIDCSRSMHKCFVLYFDVCDESASVASNILDMKFNNKISLHVIAFGFTKFKIILILITIDCFIYCIGSIFE